MFNQRYRIKGFSRRAPSDGSVLVLACSKSDGIALYRQDGFSKRIVVTIDPAFAEIRKFAPGDLNFVTNRHSGEWEVRVLNENGGGFDFHMRSKGDALSLKRWIEKYAARKGGR